MYLVSGFCVRLTVALLIIVVCIGIVIMVSVVQFNTHSVSHTYLLLNYFRWIVCKFKWFYRQCLPSSIILLECQTAEYTMWYVCGAAHAAATKMNPNEKSNCTHLFVQKRESTVLINYVFFIFFFHLCAAPLCADSLFSYSYRWIWCPWSELFTLLFRSN